MYILWWKFMDLSLLQNFFNLDTHFSNGEFWEPPFLNEKFWPLWPKIEFFSLQRFHSTKQANGEFFVVYQDRLKVFWQRVLLSFIHNSYSFLQSNQTLQAFLQNYFKELWTLQVLIYIDFSSCFDFSYFQSPESESSCHASHCELSKCFPNNQFFCSERRLSSLNSSFTVYYWSNLCQAPSVNFDRSKLQTQAKWLQKS